LWEQRERFNKLGVSVLIITFESHQSASIYAQEGKMDWPIVIDENRYLYKRYKMHRASFWDLWGLPTWWAYGKQLFKGNLPSKPTGDIRQRGGNVLLDKNGTIRLHHVGTGPADRPTVESILNRVSESSNQKKQGEHS
jgi:hypothetical protein